MMNFECLRDSATVHVLPTADIDLSSQPIRPRDISYHSPELVALLQGPAVNCGSSLRALRLSKLKIRKQTFHPELIER